MKSFTVDQKKKKERKKNFLVVDQGKAISVNSSYHQKIYLWRYKIILVELFIWTFMFEFLSQPQNFYV